MEFSFPENPTLELNFALFAFWGGRCRLFFNFWPKNSPESERVNEIIGDLKEGMLPKVSEIGVGAVPTSPFFKSPRHYKIKFLLNHNQIFL